MSNPKIVQFHNEMRRQISAAGHRYTGDDFGRMSDGRMFHEVTALTDNAVETYRVIVPKGDDPWDLELCEEMVYEFQYGPLHYCTATNHCNGGRNDCGDWERVNCLECLKSQPTRSQVYTGRVRRAVRVLLGRD
jgi:hypothetical protein